MKQNRGVNIAIVIAFCYGILFPSVHAVEHFYENFAKQRCAHKYHEGKTELSHTHYDVEKCFECEFRISPHASLAWTFQLTSFREADDTYHYFHYICSKAAYSGFYKSLRAPPTG
jgi:hypothetical protein